MKIDLQCCYDAIKNIDVKGIPCLPLRKKMIEDAIAEIQEKGDDAFKDRYLGIKSYASFGDQREDHQYGHHPRHGSIVFSIGKKAKSATCGKKEIYFLECLRDFGYMDHPTFTGRKINLGEALKLMADYNKKSQLIIEKIFEVDIETHKGDEN